MKSWIKVNGDDMKTFMEIVKINPQHTEDWAAPGGRSLAPGHPRS